MSLVTEYKRLPPGHDVQVMQDIVVKCDNCGEENHGEGLEFDDLLSDLRDLGWGMFKNERRGKWQHFCQSCNRKHKRRYVVA
jgi:hypothetical protein